MNKKRNITIAVILSIFLILIVILIKTNNMDFIDNKVYSFIEPMINNTNTSIFKFITFFGSVLFIVIITLLILIFGKRRGVNITLVVIISTLVNNIVKVIIKRPRPEVLKLVVEKSYSFPSGHTMASATLAGIIVFYIWKSNIKKLYKVIISIVLSLLVFSIIFSRIYLGAHYFSDVLGGMITSIIVLIIYITFIEPKISNYKRIEK